MPNCFTLTRKNEDQPATLNSIDIELCALLNRPVDDKWYCANWYNIIGFALACGQSLEQVRSTLIAQQADAAIGDEVTHYSDLIKACDYLITNYKSDAWAEVWRR